MYFLKKLVYVSDSAEITLRLKNTHVEKLGTTQTDPFPQNPAPLPPTVIVMSSVSSFNIQSTHGCTTENKISV
jgi:hypothetical protein